MKQTSCKLFETLARANMKLNDGYNPDSYNCTESCPWNNKCFYKVQCPPEDRYLQNSLNGWQKYAVYEINDKKCKLDWNNCICIGILHLITPIKADDIIIFRIVKKNKNDDGYSIRYVCTQSNRSQLCANIKELNNHMDKKCQYIGRPITKEDFVIENKKDQENV